VSDDKKILQFPIDRIVNPNKAGISDSKKNKSETKDLQKIREEETKRFCEGATNDISMTLLSQLVELACKTQTTSFTKDLALLIDVLRGLIYRDFGLKHPTQMLVDKVVTLNTQKNGQQSAKLDYSKILDMKKSTKPISKEIKEELKDIQDGAGSIFNPDGDLND